MNWLREKLRPAHDETRTPQYDHEQRVREEQRERLERLRQELQVISRREDRDKF